MIRQLADGYFIWQLKNKISTDETDLQAIFCLVIS